jgi:hypothetical protein
MKTHKYLFTEHNVPNANKDKINQMNDELIGKIQRISRFNSDFYNNPQLFDDACQVLSEEVFVKYSGRD